MKTLTILCNIVSVLFTCFVLATDGLPTKAAYIVLTLLVVLIPIYTVFALVRSGAGEGQTSIPAGSRTPEPKPAAGARSSRGSANARAAAICNVVLLGFVCWALVDQYPHPAEPGFLEYVVLTMVTPVLSTLVLFRIARGGGSRRPQMKGGVLGEEGEAP